MEATKVKGIVNEKGQLIIEETINLSAGEVEIIILKTDNLIIKKNHDDKGSIKCKSKTFKDLLETEMPINENFDIDENKWNYLKEKHNL